MNGRIPRINRMLNAYCTFRVFLGVCLVQGDNVQMHQLVFQATVWFTWVVALLCVSVQGDCPVDA